MRRKKGIKRGAEEQKSKEENRDLRKGLTPG